MAITPGPSCIDCHYVQIADQTSVLETIVQDKDFTTEIPFSPLTCGETIGIANDRRGSQKAFGQQPRFVARLNCIGQDALPVGDKYPLAALLSTITTCQDTNFFAFVGKCLRDEFDQRCLASSASREVANADYRASELRNTEQSPTIEA